MTEPVQFRHDGEVAILTIDNPPVNALKQAVRAGVLDGLNRATGDDEVAAIVLCGAGRGFSAGADISEFGQPSQAPSLPELIAAIEDSAKPVVAALHGNVLGGGLELALGCHYRIAAADARLGLPEVKLGLLPGAGGTQRLPRLVGAEAALTMIVSGSPVSPDKAEGLVDEIVDADPVPAAIAFARKAAAEGRPLAKVREREEKLEPTRADPSGFEALAGRLTARARGLRAPQACVEAVRGALELSFEDGLKRERGLFEELRESEQSKAQRHVFFAERAAAKVADLPADVKPREISRAAVIGAGTMGGGIAMCFANAGIPVSVIETNEEALARGLDTVARNYARSVSRGSISEDIKAQRMGLIQGGTDMAAVARADIVIEAVFEEMDIKRQVFGELDRLARPGTILATNTSYLDVNEIARVSGRPQDVLGTHFFSPANVMRLLEVVRGEATAPDVLATAIALGRRLGKVPVVVGVCHGFVGNRMLSARGIEAERLLIEGALPHEVDGALTDFGFPMGPFAMSDLAGLDVSWRMRKSRGETAEIADALCEQGRFGQKTGRGFYLYEAGSRAPTPDPEVEALINAASERHGVSRRAIGEAEIIERLVYPMINEGARILEEGIAQRPGDIDVIWVYGYGFPVGRGGPMHYADTIGLAHIRDRLAHYAERSQDERLTPAPLIARLADAGKGFAD